MTDYAQPWRRIEIDGRRCRLQILDPETAFDLESEIVEAIGDAAAFAVAAPDELLGSVWRHTAPGASGLPEMHDLARDPVAGPAIAANAITIMGRLLAECVSEANINPRWMASAFRQMILGRLDVDGRIVWEMEDWIAEGFEPVTKWRALAAQVRQTYGPLWTRSPYRLRASFKDYGVKAPASVSMATRWANTLAQKGSASSAREILREWTPVQMIEIVETAAYEAEIERRAQDQAKAGGR